MAACSEYLTLESPAQAQLREKMSRFIAYAIPVDTAEAARAEIARLSRDYHDARHVCWAYRLGADGATWLSTDNGEPSGTAGKPILGQMRSAGVTNLLIVVVRYFGGIKLGTPGLIAAYREAARLAIEAGHIITAWETEKVNFTFPYLAMNDVMRLVKDTGLRIVGQQFDNTCSMTLEIRADEADALRNRLSGIDGVSVSQTPL